MICNSCADEYSLEPKSINGKGIVDVACVGDFESDYLTKYYRYKFWLCEACISKIFLTFKIAPIKED